MVAPSEVALCFRISLLAQASKLFEGIKAFGIHSGPYLLARNWNERQTPPATILLTEPSEPRCLGGLKSFLHGDRDLQTFRAGESALNTVRSQEGFTFEFERQCDVQQVESPAAKALSMLV